MGYLLPIYDLKFTWFQWFSAIFISIMPSHYREVKMWSEGKFTETSTRVWISLVPSRICEISDRLLWEAFKMCGPKAEKDCSLRLALAQGFTTSPHFKHAFCVTPCFYLIHCMASNLLWLRIPWLFFIWSLKIQFVYNDLILWAQNQNMWSTRNFLHDF